MADVPDAAKAAIGKHLAAEDEVTAAPVAAMWATFGRTGPPPGPGDALPPLWHGLYCTAKLPPDRLGPDGLARDEPLLPDVPGYPRRRFGGARYDFLRPIRIGEAIRRESEIAAIDAKSGRAGPFLLALVRHTIVGLLGPATVEENDILYLPSAQPGGGAGQGGADEPPGRAVWSRTIMPDPVLMFRHSALTFNSHRIHYDRAYAAAQGEPGLLVQGSLIARLMLELVAAERPARSLGHFSFRAGAPVHDTAPFTIAGEPYDPEHGAKLWAVRADGRIAMTALVDFE